MPDAVLEISTTIARYQAEMSKLPGFTDKMAAQAAVKLATRMNKGSQEAADKARESVNDVAKEMGKGVGDVAKAGKLAFPAIGELGEKLKGTIEAFGALGPAGIAVGVVAGLGLIVGAAYKAGSVLIDLQEAAYQDVERLHDLADAGVAVLPEGDLKRIEDAHWALEGVDVAAGALRDTLVSELSPGIRRVMTDVIALTLMAIDHKEKLADFGLTVLDVLAPGSGTAIRGLIAVERATGATETALGYYEARLGSYLTRAEELIAANRELEQNGGKKAGRPDVRWKEPAEWAERYSSALDAISKQTAEAASDEVSAQDKIIAAYNDRLIAISEIERKTLAGLDDAMLSDDELAASKARLYEEIASAGVAAEARMYREIEALAKETADKRIAEAQRVADAEAAIAARAMDARLQIATYGADFLGQIGDLVVQNEAEGSKSGEGIQKAAAITEVIISSLAAGMKAWEAYGDIPFVGPILAAAQDAMIAGIAGVQIGKIASAYTGIDLPYASSRGTPVLTHPGERVMDRTEADAWRRSGRQADQVPSILLDGRDLSRSWTRNSRRGGVTAKEQRARVGRIGQRIY
jgi:hypothetical protein